MPVLVVLSSEALDVVLAGSDWALLRPLILVGEQMCFEILDVSTTGGDWADALVLLGVQGRLALSGVV